MAPPPPAFHLVIPGDPPVGKRPRARLTPTMPSSALMAKARRATAVADLLSLFRADVYHPSKGYMREWQRMAVRAMDLARTRVTGSAPIVAAGRPIEVWILAVFPLPKSRWRKRSTPPRAWQLSANAGDFDNIAKPICDAANGVLWPDDVQVARAHVEKVVAAQGEHARVEILIRELVDAPHRTMFEEQRAMATFVDGESLPPQHQEGLPL